MTKTESANRTVQAVVIEACEQLLECQMAAGVRLAIPNTNNLIMVGPADWIAKNVPGVEAMVEGDTPAIGKLLDEFSALPVLWGLNEPGALIRHSDVFKMLINAGKTYLAATTQASTAQAEQAEWSDAQREAARDALSAELGSAMDCTRVWSAWGVSTMSEGDFQLLADNDERLDNLVGVVEAAIIAATSSTDARATVAQGEQADEVRERVRDAVAQELTGVYYCGRVWSAWGVGTMSEDDFTPAAEVDEVLDEITDAAIRALRACDTGEQANGGAA